MVEGKSATGDPRQVEIARSEAVAALDRPAKPSRVDDDVQVADHVARIERYPAPQGYRYVDATLQSFAGTHVDSELRARRLRRLLLSLIEHASIRIGDDALCPGVRTHYWAAFQRIAEQTMTQPDSFYSLDNDKFLKDFGLCRLCLYPVSAGLVERHDRIPARFALAGFPREALGKFMFVLRYWRRREPVYRIHVDSRHTDDFSPTGWDRAYLWIAQMLALNEGVHGILRNAWFFDPALKTISPHLAYLNERINGAGGYVFYAGKPPGGAADSLARSKTRRALHERGEYEPKTYLAFWPREAVLDWAERTFGTAWKTLPEPPA